MTQRKKALTRQEPRWYNSFYFILRTIMELYERPRISHLEAALDILGKVEIPCDGYTLPISYLKNIIYVLCYENGVPFYVGQSSDAGLERLKMHLISQRSDPVAKKQLDPYDTGIIKVFPHQNIVYDVKTDLNILEYQIWQTVIKDSPYVNTCNEKLPKNPYRTLPIPKGYWIKVFDPRTPEQRIADFKDLHDGLYRKIQDYGPYHKAHHNWCRIWNAQEYRFEDMQNWLLPKAA